MACTNASRPRKVTRLRFGVGFGVGDAIVGVVAVR